MYKNNIDKYCVHFYYYYTRFMYSNRFFLNIFKLLRGWEYQCRFQPGKCLRRAGYTEHILFSSCPFIIVSAPQNDTFHFQRQNTIFLPFNLISGSAFNSHFNYVHANMTPFCNRHLMCPCWVNLKHFFLYGLTLQISSI